MKEQQAHEKHIGAHKIIKEENERIRLQK